MVLQINSPVLVEQANFDVTQSELDAALYEMNQDARGQIAYDHAAIEAVILNHLKYEFFYDFLAKNELLSDPYFQEKKLYATGLADEKEDISFLTEYDYEADHFSEIYRSFLIKKYVFQSANEFYKNGIDVNIFDEYIEDWFKGLKLSDTAGKTSKITVIEFPLSAVEKQDVVDFLKNQVQQNDYQKLIDGLSAFKPEQQVKHRELTLTDDKKFNLPFIDDVFKLNHIGMVKNVFLNNGFLYLVRINDVYDGREAYIKELKESKRQALLAKKAEQKIQSILDSYQTNNELHIKPELADAFERYKK